MNLANFEDIYGDYNPTVPDSTRMPRNILITGSSGMLGHGLAVTVQKLLQIDDQCQTTIYLASRTWTDQSKKFWEPYSNIKLLRNTEMKTLGISPDLVIHAASPSNFTQIKSQEELLEINFGIARNILTLEPRRIVYISSGEVYGGTSYQESRLKFETITPDARNWYPITKIKTENLLLEKTQYAKTSIAIIRLFHTFGPGVRKDDGRSFADIIWNAAQGHEIRLHSAGTQTRTFLYLADAIDAILRVAANESLVHEIYNVGSTKPLQIIEFAQIAASLEGINVRTEEKSDYSHSQLDSVIPTLSNIRSTGWKASFDVPQGIQLSIDWAKKNI